MNRSRRWLHCALLMLLLLPLAPAPDAARAAVAAGGDLDPSFGVGGKVTTSFPIPTSSNARALIIQADGKLVAAGNSEGGVALTRYRTDGSVDHTFGTGGNVTAPIANRGSEASALDVQPDGKLVVAGIVHIDNHFRVFAFGLARFNPDGSLDTSFGTDGTTMFQFAGSDTASAVHILPDGKILVAGCACDFGFPIGPGHYTFGLARLLPNGSLDPSFGTGGKVSTDFGDSNDDAYTLAMQADGKIVLAGSANGGFGLARYNPDGSLDPSFGTAGTVTTSFSTRFPAAHSLLIQGDGKIVAIGATDQYPTSDFALARYNPDGSLDGSFGAGGRVTTDFAGQYDQATGAVLRADGTIVVAGLTHTDTYGTSDFALASYNPTGSLTSSFGSAGTLTLDFQSGEDAATAIALQHDGRLVVAGFAGIPNDRTDFALARYSRTGSLDGTFGSGGKVTSSFLTNRGMSVNALATQTDGKIVTVGSDSKPNDPGDYSLVRYNIDGSLDTAFGSGGEVSTPISSASDYANAVAIQVDGKLVVAGTTQGSSQPDFALARYNLDGSLDQSFGTGGIVITDMAAWTDDAQAMAIQPDGKIVVAGTVQTPVSFMLFGLARYNPDGSLDPTFGAGGKVITTFPDMNASAYALALQPDQRIIVAGAATQDVNSAFALARYNPDGSLDTSFGTGGTLTTPAGQANAMALQPDGKIVVAGSVYNIPGFTLVRYTPAGSLDASFGDGGQVTADFGGPYENLSSLVLQPDGKLVVAGYNGADYATVDFALARFTAGGTLDSSFAGGKVIIHFGGPSSAGALALQSPAQLVVAGSADGGIGLARVLTGSGCGSQFVDVAPASPFYPFITCLTAHNVVAGYSDCSFRPGASVTRGQFAKFVSNAAGYSETITPTQQTFTDVPPTDPFWLYIERAANHGVISGYSNGDGTFSFRPGASVTRGQAAKFVSNAARYRDGIPRGQQSFADVPPADPFWLYIERVYAHGVISGYADGTFHPRASVTRGQTAKFIANALVPACRISAQR